MSQFFYKLTPLIFTTFSAFAVMPAQAQVLVEAHNSNVNHTSPISSELSTNSEKAVSNNSDSSSSTNKKADILSENSDNNTPNAAATTTATTSNPRIPISSRIFPVPTMEQ
ncbi:hypothetical protein NIES22_13780 [Calothrix brevissima NIES-22]|nr:hypothetical protein NIES22_13780 [Calothrix brevissima NIES-22]